MLNHKKLAQVKACAHFAHCFRLSVSTEVKTSSSVFVFRFMFPQLEQKSSAKSAAATSNEAILFL